MKVRDLIRILTAMDDIDDFDIEIFDTNTGRMITDPNRGSEDFDIDITHDREERKIYLEV